MVIPPCDCGAAAEGRQSHRFTCAIASAIRGRPPASAAAAPLRPLAPLGPVAVATAALDGLGRPARGRLGQRGTPTTVGGIVIRTRLEALVFRRLLVLGGGVVLRAPRFDLWSSWREGAGKPLTFTPDFLRFLEGGRVEVHEAKGPRDLQSRDFVARLAAFRAMLPWLPVTIWRRDRDAGPEALVREDLAALGNGDLSVVPTSG